MRRFETANERHYDGNILRMIKRKEGHSLDCHVISRGSLSSDDGKSKSDGLEILGDQKVARVARGSTSQEKNSHKIILKTF